MGRVGVSIFISAAKVDGTRPGATKYLEQRCRGYAMAVRGNFSYNSRGEGGGGVYRVWRQCSSASSSHLPYFNAHLKIPSFIPETSTLRKGDLLCPRQ